MTQQNGTKKKHDEGEFDVVRIAFKEETKFVPEDNYKDNLTLPSPEFYRERAGDLRHRSH